MILEAINALSDDPIVKLPLKEARQPHLPLIGVAFDQLHHLAGRGLLKI
jgi:hypothetical protein